MEGKQETTPPRFRIVPVWMTFNDLFKVTIIQRQITWKWYNIELYLQWPTNRKSYNGLSNGAIFNDLERPLPADSRSSYSFTLNISEIRHTLSCVKDAMCNLCSDALQTAAAAVVVETVSCCSHLHLSRICGNSRWRLLWEDLHERRPTKASRRMWTEAHVLNIDALSEPVQQEKFWW